MYRINEGDTTDICAVVLGPEQISTGLEVFATLSAVPDTADGGWKINEGLRAKVV